MLRFYSFCLSAVFFALCYASVQGGDAHTAAVSSAAGLTVLLSSIRTKS